MKKISFKSLILSLLYFLILVFSVNITYADTNDSRNSMLFGDVDGNGILTATDSAFILAKVINNTVMPIENITNDYMRYADVDNDQKLTTNDAVIVLKKVLDKSYTMPCENPPLILDKKDKTLIAYFSWSGNSEKMASYIAEQTNGDLYKIEPKTPYPEIYEECGAVARVERDENLRPEIANLPDSIDEYNSIFVCYPIWWHTAPMIIGTFLESYDLSDINIYPVTQSASMDRTQFENSMEFIKENAKNANVHEALFTRYSNINAILEYLQENGFTE